MFKLEISLQTLEVISRALGNMPYTIAAPVIAELQKQVNAQQPVPASANGHAKETELVQ